MQNDFEVLAEIRRPAHAPGAKRTVQRCPAALVMSSTGLELHLQPLEPIAQGAHISVEIPLFSDAGKQTVVRLQGPAMVREDGICALPINRSSHLLRRAASAAK